MKKSRLKKIGVIVCVACIALIAAALSLSRPAPMPSFKFLDGHEPTSGIRELSKGQTSLTYSFEIDFNDVFADANQELSALGYVQTDVIPVPRIYTYELRSQNGITRIDILDKHRYKLYSTPRNSEYSSPDKHTYDFEHGWVSVNITQTHHPSRFMMMFQFAIYKIRSWFS